MNYAYLRVSTADQDENNQFLGIKQKAQSLNLTIDKIYVDKVSGVTRIQDRSLGKLMKRLKEGDVIFISELSRLARSTTLLFQIVGTLLERRITLYSIKDNFTLDDSIQSKILVFAFGVSAEVERTFIVQRTREALAYRKQQGVKLGRPLGSKTKHHKLDAHRKAIFGWLKKGLSFYRIAKKLKVCRLTVKKYVADRQEARAEINELDNSVD